MPDESIIAAQHSQSIDDRINRAATEAAQKVMDNAANLDADIVLALAIISDLLCRAHALPRETLVSLLRTAHEARHSAWKNGYTPLGLLADWIQLAGQSGAPSDTKPSASWLREVIEGGLSNRPTNSSE